MDANLFKTWGELTDGERFDILHSENSPTLITAIRSLWRITKDGWDCKDRTETDPRDIFGCQ